MTELEKEFRKRKPWITKFVIDGKAYGGKNDLMDDARVHQFRALAPNAQRILELGSLEGAHSFTLARLPGVVAVVALEGRDHNLDKARFVQRLLRVDNVTFQKANLERDALAAFGTFDAVFCVGVLYHLPNPWFLIEQIAKVAPQVFLWTHYASEVKANEIREGFRGQTYREHGMRDPLSGLSRGSFWLAYDDLLRLLRQHGFSQVQILQNSTDHPNGASVTLMATKAD